MDITFNNKFSQKNTLIKLSVICVILGVLSCVAGELLLPFIVGVLAAIYLFDNKEKKTFGLWVTVILIVLNAVAVFFGFTISFFGICAPILARMICSAFTRNQSKADTAYLMTLISAGFSVFSLVFLAMAYQQVYTIDAVLSFYGDLADYLREVFVATTLQIYSEAGIQEINRELVVSVFNQQISLLISYVIIGAFAIVGISMKMFGFIASRYAEDNTPVLKWRFVTTNVYAYFYVILAFVSVFVNPANVLGASVLNLYNIFMVVFAYVGFNYALAMFRRRMKKVTSFILLSIITVVFITFAIQLLAFLGVIFTIRESREIKPQTPLNP